LAKVTQPTYRVEPPDILLIDSLRLTPKPPYRAEVQDQLGIEVRGVLPTEPIAGFYQILPDGTVNLGLSYGSVQVAGLTLDEIKRAIEKHLQLKKFKEPEAFITVGASRAMQQIRGEHIVRPDGTLWLGNFGSLPVAGLTLPEVKTALEAHLSQYLVNPEVSVDVAAYNSKVIYVIFDQAGSGQTLTTLPVTGRETVLDAVSQLGGLSGVSSAHRIWIARPAPAGAPCDQILPVDWAAITTRARTETNYQLMPGDRLYVDGQSIITVNTVMAKVLAPIQQLSGAALLARGTISAFAFGLKGTGTTNGGNAFFP
jgi:polysaccharide export outer membrane protein